MERKTIRCELASTAGRNISHLPVNSDLFSSAGFQNINDLKETANSIRWLAVIQMPVRFTFEIDTISSFRPGLIITVPYNCDILLHFDGWLL